MLGEAELTAHPHHRGEGLAWLGVGVGVGLVLVLGSGLGLGLGLGLSVGLGLGLGLEGVGAPRGHSPCCEEAAPGCGACCQRMGEQRPVERAPPPPPCALAQRGVPPCRAGNTRLGGL